MDLELVLYNYDLHYHMFWPLYAQYWREVNGEDLEKLKTVYAEGRPLVISKIEEKLAAVHRDLKRIKIIILDGQPAGFLQYKYIEGGVLFIDAMFSDPKVRFQGLARFMVNSFPGTKKWLFQIHRDMRPDALLDGMMTARKVSDCDDRDLELWEAEYSPEGQGSNVAAINVKKEHRHG